MVMDLPEEEVSKPPMKGHPYGTNVTRADVAQRPSELHTSAVN